jgi:hypothetical protein
MSQAAVTISSMIKSPSLLRCSRLFALCALSVLMTWLASCDPALNWREVRSNDAGYSALFPAKPTSFERAVNLDGLQVMMNMTAAEADGVSFAVATAIIEDEGQRTKALIAMQTAMLRNIQGEIKEKKTVTVKGGATAIQMHAAGQAGQAGTPLVLFARFVMHERRVFQVIALGPKEKLSAETADTFLSSFAFN